MILDKILAQGKHVEGNENDASYELYTYTFNPNTSDIVINLQTAVQSKFPGSSDAEKTENQEKKRQAMLTKLLNDLSLLLGPGFDDIKYIESDSKARKLTIKAGSYDLIAKYINTHAAQSDMLRIGMNIINVFLALYLTVHRREVLKQALENKLGGLIYYRKDNSVAAARFPHQFYIGKVIPDSQNDPVKANIEELGQQLRDAFKFGIARILNKSSIDFVDTHYEELDALSFNLSDADFNALKSTVGVSNVVTGQTESIEQRADRRPAEGGEQQNGKKETFVPSIAEGEIGELNGSVFDNYRIQLPSYSEKEVLIKTAREKFLAVHDINKLIEMYKYINLEINKVILNIHEHPIYDKFFFKTNTNSWQKLIEDIRNHALKELFTSLHLDMKNVLTRIKNNEMSFPNPRAVKEALMPHLTNPLFCEHRSNSHFRNLFHPTAAVKKLQSVIAYCDEQIKKENAPQTGRLLVSHDK